MALKIVSAYQPGALKVVNNNNGIQYSPSYPVANAPSAPINSTANPQTVGKNTGQTYNPQPAATVRQTQNLTAKAFAEANARAQVERDRIAAEQAVIKRRAIDAKNNEIAGKQGNIIKKLGDKASFGDLRRQRGGRELAARYYQENEKNWGGQIMSRQRNYENKGAQLKDWVMQADNEAEYNKRVQEANSWLDKEYGAITSDIDDYTKTQTELAQYAQTALNGKFASIGRGAKNLVTGITSKSWGALTGIASQPQRAVNTAKNFVNPGNLRQYYGGEEKQNPKDIEGKGSNPFSLSWDQLRKSYNASKNQRIVSFSKADEAERLKVKKYKMPVRQKDGSIKYVEGTRNPSAVDRYRVKYGDDVVDMMLDPLSFLGGGGAKAVKSSKFDKLLAFAGKNKFARNAVISGTTAKEWIKQSKVGTTFKKLGEEVVPRQERAKQATAKLSDDLTRTIQEFRNAKSSVYDNFGSELKLGNKIKSDFITRQAAHSQRLMADAQGFKQRASELSQDFVKRLNDFSDKETRALTRFARNGDWSAVDKLTISKYRRADLTKFLSDYQTKAKVLAKSEGLTRGAKNYLPEFTGRSYDPTARRTLFGEKYFGQGRQQLQESIVMRDFVSQWDESNDYLKQLSAVEKSILRNVKRTGRGLSTIDQQQLDIIKQRRAALERVKGRYGSKFDAIRGAIDKTQQAAKPAIRFAPKQINTRQPLTNFSKEGFKRIFPTNFTKQGAKNTAADIFHLPMSVWKKSVLKYNPAWYVNNAAWNVPASVSAAGADVFSEYGKLLTNRKYWNDVRKNVPEGVMSKISQEIGKGGLATKIEDTSRLATFLALRKQGYTDDAALKQVNRWLFDYGTKNWERPIKGILPFWQWQKNIVRLGTTMPFHSPRSAKVYSEGYKKFYERPYENLPDEVQTYTDPETGEQVEYNPRRAYKGKAYLGKDKKGKDRFAGLPFFAVNPDTALQFGTNPYLLSAADYVTSEDRLGNKNTDRSAASILGERFPQANLIRNYLKRNKKSDALWFSQSGNSKSKQGYDESKPNYVSSLDNRTPFKNSLKSFAGVPRVVKFDRSEFETKKRLTSFNKEFFATDWETKESQDYKKAQLEKEALARKYGFDLKKDIYDNYWSKYDTETTTRTKNLKQEAAQFNSPDSGWWKGYFDLPSGSASAASKRRPYLIGKFAEWKRDHTFATNPYYKLPKKGELNPFTLRNQESQSVAKRAVGKVKYQRKLEYEKALKTGDWSFFAGSGKGTSYKSDGKFFKSQESMDKYLAGKAKFEKSELWREYYSLSSVADKQAWLAKHPELRTFAQPQTQADWDNIRTTLRKQRNDKLDTMTGFVERRKAIASRTTAAVRTSFGGKTRVRYKG